MEPLNIGLDAGNDGIKMTLMTTRGGEPYILRQRIPNVISRGMARNVVELEQRPWEALDVTIRSDALSPASSGSQFFVGDLALVHRGRMLEVRPGSHKAQEDQTYIAGLTVMAVVAAQHVKNASEIDIFLSTVLPVNDYTTDNGLYSQRWKRRHTVEFGTVPGLEHRKVTLNVKRVQVLPEGMPALYLEDQHWREAVAKARAAGANPDELRDWRRDIRTSVVSLLDIGALTVDAPTFKQFKYDNTRSEGYQVGLAEYLDNITRDAARAFDYLNLGRANVVDALFNKAGHLMVHGRDQDLTPIAEPHLSAYTERIAMLIRERWARFPEIQHMMLVGGGAEVVRDRLGNYLDRGKYHVHFAHKGDAIWENSLGALGMLKALSAAEQAKQEAAAAQSR